MPFTLDDILPWGRSINDYVAMFALTAADLDKRILGFHIQAVIEMHRVAREIRIFPLLDMSGQPSRHLPAVCEVLSGHGFRWAIQAVEYEFQRGGNKMLRIQHGDG